MKIKNIVSKTLIEEREKKLVNSLNALRDIKEPSLFIENYFKISKNLINEGYSKKKMKMESAYTEIISRKLIEKRAIS